MRALVIIVLLAASPATAQVPAGPMWEGEARLQQEMARQRSIDLENRLTSMEMQGRADAAVRQVEAQRQRPQMPNPVTPPVPRADAGADRYVSIPDDRLSQSNQRVRDAGKRR